MKLILSSLIAALSGGSIGTVLIYLVVYIIVFSFLWWLLSKFNPKEPFIKTILTIVLVLVGVLLIIDLLLSLIGRSFLLF